MMRAARACGRRGLASRAEEASKAADGQDEFRVLDFLKRRQRPVRTAMRREAVAPPRALAMSPEQSWPSVWPGPRSFHPASVPLPLRQGYPLRAQVAPSAAANAELMKIPNFLHLTPPAVSAQCEAIKPFCTPWPAGFETEEGRKRFPLEIITSDYCHSGPSIRDPLSRIVSVKIKLSHLKLDEHANDKLRRLVGDRYDEETDILTVVADRCPTKKQNLDYALYLLTAVYHESWTVEPWELEKTEADMEVYVWKNNRSKKSVIDWFDWKLNETRTFSDEDYQNYDVAKIPKVAEYADAVSDLINVGENDYQTEKYKRAVMRLFGLPVPEQLSVADCNKM